MKDESCFHQEGGVKCIEIGANSAGAIKDGS